MKGPEVTRLWENDEAYRALETARAMCWKGLKNPKRVDAHLEQALILFRVAKLLEQNELERGEKR